MRMLHPPQWRVDPLLGSDFSWFMATVNHRESRSVMLVTTFGRSVYDELSLMMTIKMLVAESLYW